MSKYLLVILIVSLLAVSGCVKEDTNYIQDYEQTDQQPEPDMLSVKPDMPANKIELEWKQVGTKQVLPTVVYNNELYGQSYGRYDLYNTYKLEGDDWEKFGTESIYPSVVYNGELYGESQGNTYKLADNEWELFGTAGVAIVPIVNYNNELYGYGKVDLYTYKLVGGSWEQVGTKQVRPILFYNNELYGSGFDLDARQDKAYKLLGGDWVEIGKVKVIYNSGGFNFRHVIPTVVYNGELYGVPAVSTEYLTETATYKLTGADWVKIESEPVGIEPIVVYNGELYGYESYTYTPYKLVKKS